MDRSKLSLEDLRRSETILAFSYWENWNYLKMMAQALSGTNPLVKKIDAEVNHIREEWNQVSLMIKELENGSDKHEKS